jgi:hypothetical protein
MFLTKIDKKIECIIMCPLVCVDIMSYIWIFISKANDLNNLSYYCIWTFIISISFTIISLIILAFINFYNNTYKHSIFDK